MSTDKAVAMPETIRFKQNRYSWAIIDQFGDPCCQCHGIVWAFSLEEALASVKAHLDPKWLKYLEEYKDHREVMLHGTCIGIECGCQYEDVPRNYDTRIEYKPVKGRPKKFLT